MLQQYRYSVILKYMYNGKEEQINSNNIHNIVVDYDYDNKNMPIIFITASIDKNMIDDMIQNSKTKLITMRICKFINNVDLKIEEEYIYDQFIYFLSNDLNYNKELDYSKDTKDSEDIYRKITIGLMDQKLIDNNKVLINEIIQEASLTETLVYYMSDRPLLLEPVDNVKLNYFMIPPMNSKSKLIEFLDNNFNLYNNKYRLFYDFKRTYLLSSSGNSVPYKGEPYSTVIIKVSTTLKDDSKVQGMEIVNGAYVVDIGVDFISYTEDKVTDRTNTGVMTIGTDGSYSIGGDSTKVKITRTTTNNTNIAVVQQSQVDNNSFIISVLKTELDSSVFTINKEYRIQNYDKLKDKDGKFLLSRKNEVYTPDNGNFILSTMLIFRKAIS